MPFELNCTLMVVYACGAGAFVLYSFLATAKPVRRFFEKRWGASHTVFHVPFARIAGGALMGLLPFAGIVLENPIHGVDAGWEIKAEHMVPTVIWIAVLAIPSIIGAFLQSKKEKHRLSYPEIRVASWSPGIISIHIISWGIYLLGYETMFRGYFVLQVADQMGFWYAASISTVLYAIAHYNKGWGQILGALPYGMLLCWISWETGTIWVAFATHLIMAVSNGLFSVRHSDTMHFVNE